MAHQPFDNEEHLFLETTGLGEMAAPPSLSEARRARVVAQARQKLGLTAQPEQQKKIPARAWGRIAGVLVACAAVVVTALLVPQRGDVALAMEKAVLSLKSYHGVLEWTARSAAPDAGAQSVRKEIWWQGDQFAVQSSHQELYSDGEQLWQVNPQGGTATARWAMGDATWQPFDLRWVAALVTSNPHRETGTETILGRKTIKLEGEQPGGLPFTLWVDAQTNLPLQVQLTEPGGRTELGRYLSLEVDPQIDPNRFLYHPTGGLRVEQQTRGHLVRDMKEARQLAGFPLLDPQESLRKAVIEDQPIGPGKTATLVWLDYGDTLVQEQAQVGDLTPPPTDDVVLGRTAGGLAVIRQGSITWVHEGIRIYVAGARWLEFARRMAPDLTLPDPKEDLAAAAAVKVAVDLTHASELQRAADRGADAGHLVLRDLVQEFTHQPGVPLLVASTGAQAVVELPMGKYKRLYLVRPVRQDLSGIWMVAGYDLR